MKNFKFKIIKKFDEDVIGFFARQNYLTFKPSKTSNYLKKCFLKKRNSPYKVLYFKHRKRFFKRRFFEKNAEFRWFRLFRQVKNPKKWWRRFWMYRSQDKLYTKGRKKKEYLKGSNSVYNLTTVYNTEFIENSKNSGSIKRNLFWMRKKLKKFYEFKTLKKFILILYPKKLYNKRLGYSYAYLLEARLEVILYRANFFISILEARQAIIHKHVLVNGYVINKPHYIIKIGHIITLNTFVNNILKYKLLAKILLQKQILINYPPYLEVNYRLFSIMLIKNPETFEVPFPFLLNFEFMKYRSIK